MSSRRRFHYYDSEAESQDEVIHPRMVINYFKINLIDIKFFKYFKFF